MNIERTLIPQFPNLKTQDYFRLRQLIQCNEISIIQSLISENPRWLISPSDSPTILQVGARYNAFHVAVINGRDEILKLLINTIEDETFFLKIGLHFSFKENVLDLFLNTPDSMTGSTPLHFACKFGRIECVKILLSHHLTQISCYDKSGLLPQEVICERCTVIENDLLHDFIEKLFTGYYVALFQCNESLQNYLKIVDSISLLREQRSKILSNKDADDLRAFIGPLDLEKSRNCYDEWLRPKEKTKLIIQIRRADFFKGWERYGRKLAKVYKTQWAEFWEFCKSFCNLQTEEGLSQLEKHFVSLNDTRLFSPRQTNINMHRPRLKSKKDTNKYHIYDKNKSYYQDAWKTYRSPKTIEEDSSSSSSQSNSDDSFENYDRYSKSENDTDLLEILNSLSKRSCLEGNPIDSSSRLKSLEFVRTPVLIKNKALEDCNAQDTIATLFSPSKLNKCITNGDLSQDKLNRDSLLILYALPNSDPDLDFFAFEEDLTKNFIHVSQWMKSIQSFLHHSSI